MEKNTRWLTLTGQNNQWLLHFDILVFLWLDQGNWKHSSDINLKFSQVTVMLYSFFTNA